MGSVSSSPNSRSITGPKLRLVPFSKAHVTDSYLSWLGNPQLLRFSRNRLHKHTRESSLQYLESFSGSENFFWAVETLADNQHVGTMTTYVDAHNRTADLGILIGPEMTGFGCGKEAWGLALRHGFERLNLRKITGGTTANNTAMTRILEHWHMVREGTLRHQELLDDGEIDVLLYGMLREEWFELHGQG